MSAEIDNVAVMRLVAELKVRLTELTDEQRMEVLGLITEDFCDLCGTMHLPCYCAPCYDE